MRNRKSIIIISFVTIFFITIVYAAFSTNVSITGSGSISSTWNVGFDSPQFITCEVTSKDSGKPSTCSLNVGTSTITAAMGFASPGDVIKLSIPVVNWGSLNASTSMIAKMALTSNANSTCTNVTSYGYTISLDANGNGSTSTKKTLTTSNQTIGPVTILNKTSYTYCWAHYIFEFTYNSSATTAAGACTFTGTLTAVQTA